MAVLIGALKSEIHHIGELINLLENAHVGARRLQDHDLRNTATVSLASLIEVLQDAREKLEYQLEHPRDEIVTLPDRTTPENCIGF